MKVVVIIPAAGLGTRMAPVPSSAKDKKAHPSKQFTELAGTPILIHTLRKFAAIDEVNEILVALRDSEIEGFRERLQKEATDLLAKKIEFVVGGEHRQQSVEHALSVITAAPDDIVLVHDAVRPLVTAEIIHDVIAAPEIRRSHSRTPCGRYREAGGTHSGGSHHQGHDTSRRSGARSNASGIPLRRHQENLRRSDR